MKNLYSYQNLSKRNSEALLKVALKGTLNEKEAADLAKIIERRFPTSIQVLQTSKQRVAATIA